MADLPERDAALLLDMLLAARDITGMRHRLIHGYGEVRLDLVWMVLRDRVGPLIATLAALLPGGSAEAE